MTRVVLNPGHDGVLDKGAPAYGGLTTEAAVNGMAARALLACDRDELPRGWHLEAKRQPPVPGGLALLLATLRANRPDVLVSLHCDAHPGGWQPGRCIHRATVYWWPDDPDRSRAWRSRRLADAIRAECRFAEHAKVATTPIARAGGRSLTPGVLRGCARLAAVLLEMGFVSDPHFIQAVTDERWKARFTSSMLAAFGRFAECLRAERGGGL